MWNRLICTHKIGIRIVRVEGHPLVFAAISQESILFMVQGKAFTGTRCAKKDAVARKSTLIAGAKFYLLHEGENPVYE